MLFYKLEKNFTNVTLVVKTLPMFHLKLQLNLHRGLKSFKCDSCCKHLALAIYLIRHLITHTRVKPHNCGICGEGFITTATQLQRHFVKHTGINVHNEEFPVRTLLRKHDHINIHI